MADLNPEVLKMAQNFIEQDNDLEAFLTGPAGAGKTTELKAIVEWLEKEKINYLMVAYTHQAKKILQNKMPEGTPIRTLHSWLKKRPGINQKAKHVRALATNHQMGKPDHLQVLIVDEFSFVGEQDYLSIGELQDELLLESFVCDKCGIEYDDEIERCLKCENISFIVKNIPPIKVLYVGDLNQLSPIKGESAVLPIEPFWVKLTKIHRTTTTISEPLAKLVDMIEGNMPMSYLHPTENFQRGVDIDKLYLADKEDKIMLAYTNKAVQHHNAIIQGYKEPKIGDTIYNATIKTINTITTIAPQFQGEVVTINGIIDADSKYGPLQFLNKLAYVNFFTLDNGTTIAGIFGSYRNKVVRGKLGAKLVELNKQGKDSKQAYREYKTVSDSTCILDFNHCMTIHKSQGSEFTNVYVDSKDLSLCINTDERMKLLYVAMSRSKHSIFMNN